MKILALCLFLVAPLSLTSFADGLTAEEKQGLEETKKVLSDPTLLLQAATQNAGGAEALKELQKVAGSPENQKLIMELAADIMETLVKDAKGDADKIVLLLSELQRNPAGLEKKLTKSQRERLRNIGKKIEAKGKLP